MSNPTVVSWDSMSKDTGYFGWIVSVVFCLLLACPNIAVAQDASAVLIESKKATFLTGKKLDRKSSQAFSLWWRDAEIRDRLTAFSKAEDIAVMLDRNVDPSTVLNMGIENRTLEQIFWRISSAAKIGVCRIEDCYYFGPTDTVVALPIAMNTLSRQAKKVSRRSSVKWTIERPVLTTSIVPTKLLIEAIATKHGFSVNGLDELPHDLWYQVVLPPTSVIAQIQLMLAGFGKTFEIDPDGKSITIIDFPKTESAKRTFIVSKRPANSKELDERFPDLRISYRSKSVVATGPPRQLALLKAALVDQADPVESQPNKAERFTLNTEADRLTILRTIAQTAKLELNLGPASPADLSDRIKINVVKVTQAELIFETLRGTRFRAEVQDNQLIIK